MDVLELQYDTPRGLCCFVHAKGRFWSIRSLNDLTIMIIHKLPSAQVKIFKCYRMVLVTIVLNPLESTSQY